VPNEISGDRLRESMTMKIERIINTVDSHTAGAPTRVITGGLPQIPGDSMAEKMVYFQENLDYIRTTIIHEPRGHRGMIGAVLLPAARKEADFGVFYLDMEGCNNMCGHGTIGVCTTLIKIGWIPTSEPETKVVLDTPAGLVTTRVHIENGDVLSACLINVVSFLSAENVSISVPSGKISVDVAFGGNFFILVNAQDLRLDIIPENIPEFIRYAGLIADSVNKAVKVVHPEKKHIKNVRFVYFYGPPSNQQADSKSLAVDGGGNVDRSPCGTGTSARMAALHAHGKLSLDETFRTESVSGTLFHGKVIKQKKIGQFLGIVPEITASAYITGFHQFVIESSDPLKQGFIL